MIINLLKIITILYNNYLFDINHVINNKYKIIL